MAGYNLPDFTGPNDPAAPWRENLNRNSMRQDVIDAVNLICSRLNELDYAEYDRVVRGLNELQEDMWQQMEDEL